VTNPILSEINGLSPDAKTALMNAHSATSQPSPLNTQASPQSSALLPSQPMPAPPSMQAPSSVTAPPAMGAPPSSTSPAPKPALGTTEGDTAERQRLLQTGSGIHQIKNPVLRGLASVGDTVGRIVAPGLEREIGGTEGHHNLLLGQNEKNITNDLGIGQKEAETTNLGATTAHTQSETAGQDLSNLNEPQKAGDQHVLSGATTQHINAETNALENPSPEYEVHDTVQGPMVVNKKTGVGQHLSDNGLPIGPKVQTKVVPLQVRGEDHQVLVNDTTGEVIKDLGKGGIKPPSVSVNAGTWSPQVDTDGNPVLFNSKTGETKAAPANLGRKPNAEEQKRGDLAQNVNENLDKLQDIVTRRPDLFGPVAGRMTKAKETIGTSDPDVSALKTIEDNLGMAMQSAHGMRSAQHVATSAQSVLNGFNNEPKAMLSAIQTARDSVGTFQKNLQSPNEAGKPSSSGGSGKGVSLADARNLPQNKGKSDADITADIKAHGHTVLP
jgi:hypothetical protein